MPTVLLGPDNGVPDLDPGLALDWGNLDPLGVNIVTCHCIILIVSLIFQYLKYPT